MITDLETKALNGFDCYASIVTFHMMKQIITGRHLTLNIANYLMPKDILMKMLHTKGFTRHACCLYDLLRDGFSMNKAIMTL